MSGAGKRVPTGIDHRLLMGAQGWKQQWASAPPMGVAGGSGSAVAHWPMWSVEGAAQVALRRLLRGC